MATLAYPQKRTQKFSRKGAHEGSMSFPVESEAGRLGSILSRVTSKTLKLVSAVALAKRSAIKCSEEDEINRV